METLDPNPNPNPESPNKRLKTETLILDSSIPITPSPFDKGKAPIIVENDDGSESPENSTPRTCGICFTEKGKTFRGLIDCCDHYYCFLCIIEWSKIESRCPLCRGRFSSIRRVRKDGSFIGLGSVRVPARDQIYDPFGEPADPYARAKCSVCNGMTDECLLLLCDLCDSASHTYCVGLGATVPEGDWYCRDCDLLRAEQLDSETGDNAVTSPHGDESPSTSAPISIFDIVRGSGEEPDCGTDRLYKLVSQRPTHFSSSAIASDQPNTAATGSIPGARGIPDPSVDVSKSSARTLRNCRNVHKHINVLRENWGAFRAGSLSFSFAFSDSSGKAGQRTNVVGTSAERSGKLQKNLSTSVLQSKESDNLHDASHNKKEPYNVDRAWKLMTKAKTVQRTAKSKGTSTVSQNKDSSKLDKFIPTCVLSGRKDLMFPRFDKQKPTDKVSGRPAEGSGKPQFTRYISQAGSTSGSKHKKSCVFKSSMPRDVQVASKSSIHHNRACLASSEKLLGGLTTFLDDGSARSASSYGAMAGAFDALSPGLQKRESSALPVKQARHLNFSSKGELQTSVQSDIFHDKTSLPSDANLGRRLSDISDEYKVFACSTSSYEPIVDGSNASYVKMQRKKISVCPGRAKISSNGSKDDEAKGEIQSLVKLNMKLLCKDKRLGVDAFKEIARLSTHTILASCGFEHRKIVRFLPTLVCHHGDQTQLHRSTIVPSSCRECFYNFVKDVVNSIMSEKLNSAEVAS